MVVHMRPNKPGVIIVEEVILSLFLLVDWPSVFVTHRSIKAKT